MATQDHAPPRRPPQRVVMAAPEGGAVLLAGLRADQCNAPCRCALPPFAFPCARHSGSMKGFADLPLRGQRRIRTGFPST